MEARQKKKGEPKEGKFCLHVLLMTDKRTTKQRQIRRGVGTQSILHKHASYMLHIYSSLQINIRTYVNICG